MTVVKVVGVLVAPSDGVFVGLFTGEFEETIVGVFDTGYILGVMAVGWVVGKSVPDV